MEKVSYVPRGEEKGHADSVAAGAATGCDCAGDRGFFEIKWFAIEDRRSGFQDATFRSEI